MPRKKMPRLEGAPEAVVRRVRQPIALTLTPELQAAIERIAEVEGLSRSQFVELAIRGYLRADQRYKRIAEEAFKAA
jgi:metal-responsive CopG/Arc/MetJ family transcriptional regulator